MVQIQRGRHVDLVACVGIDAFEALDLELVP